MENELIEEKLVATPPLPNTEPGNGLNPCALDTLSPKADLKGDVPGGAGDTLLLFPTDDKSGRYRFCDAVTDWTTDMGGTDAPLLVFTGGG